MLSRVVGVKFRPVEEVIVVTFVGTAGVVRLIREGEVLDEVTDGTILNTMETVEVTEPVDWESITTKGELLMLLLTQLAPQVKIAIVSGRKILDDDTDRMPSIAAFVAASGTVTSFLWTSPSRSSALRRRFPARGRDLRHILGLHDTEPEGLRRIRNDLTHIDERIEELFLTEDAPSLLAWGSGHPTRPRRQSA